LKKLISSTVPLSKVNSYKQIYHTHRIYTDHMPMYVNRHHTYTDHIPMYVNRHSIYSDHMPMYVNNTCKYFTTSSNNLTVHSGNIQIKILIFLSFK